MQRPVPPYTSPAALRTEAESAAAALPGLLISAERLAASVDPGAHGLRRAGAGEDFWQYRPALPGDAAQAIDWRRSARSDAAFVREREAQSPRAAALWVSGAPGMAWTGDASRPTKQARGRLLALALGLLLLRGGERVGVAGQPARTGRAQAETLARDLLGAAAAELPPADASRSRLHPVLIGDFLDDIAPLQAWLARETGAGISGVLLQVLDPVEESFPFAGAVRFRAPRGAARQTRNAAGLRVAYLARLAERRAVLADMAARAGWRFGAHDTNAPPAGALLWLSGALSP